MVFFYCLYYISKGAYIFPIYLFNNNNSKVKKHEKATREHTYVKIISIISVSNISVSFFFERKREIKERESRYVINACLMSPGRLFSTARS